MFKKTNKLEVSISAAICIWIFIANLISAKLGITGWPMFFVTIFFYIQGAERKRIPDIFIGGTAGLLSALGLAYGLPALSPMLGEVRAFGLLIALILFVIIMGGTVCPVAFNNVSFAYLTAATIQLENVTVGSVINNLAVLYLGGGIILGGAVLSSVIGRKMAHL